MGRPLRFLAFVTAVIPTALLFGSLALGQPAGAGPSPTHELSGQEMFDKLFGTPGLDARFRNHLGNYLSSLYNANGVGPLNDKIIEARDRYARKLNAQLVPAEQQNVQRAQEMFDYAKDRFNSLSRQIQSP